MAAGSFSKRLGVKEGMVLAEPTIEFSYKNDELGDLLINSHFAKALKLATESEIETIEKYAFQVNDILKVEYLKAGLRLIDFKIEFGRFHGKTILADEISPDTCRLWDIESGEKMDKDRFRRDLQQHLSGLNAHWMIRQISDWLYRKHFWPQMPF